MAEETTLKDRVTELLDTAINPAVAGHGGYIELIDVKDSTVYIRMSAAVPGLRRRGRDAEGGHRADDLRGDPRGHRGPGHDGSRLGLESLLRPVEGLTRLTD